MLDDEIRAARDRLRALERAVAGAEAALATGVGAPRSSFRVVDGGSMPKTVPAFFAAVPTSVATGSRECEGCPVPREDLGADARPVLVLGPAVPAVGDILRARQVDRYWVARSGPARAEPPTIDTPCLCPATPQTWNMAVNLGSNDPREYYYLQSTPLNFSGYSGSTIPLSPTWTSPELTGTNKLGQTVTFTIFFICYGSTAPGGQPSYQRLMRLSQGNSFDVIGAFGTPQSCSPFLLVPTVNSVQTGANSFYARGGSVVVTG